MDAADLLPQPTDVAVDRVDVDADRITIKVVSLPTVRPCPSCGLACSRVHSRYVRRLADLPWGDRSVCLDIEVRRFFCGRRGCDRRIFAERLLGVAHVRARKTMRLQAALRFLGLALGGEAGARVATRLHMPTDGDSILRLVIAGCGPTSSPVRILGVDDWAWKKGRDYGTVLVDLERRRVVDLLADRSARSLVDWLARHPDVQVVARDRAGAYADGIRQGAPQAIQVADRWHLLSNVTAALKRVVDRRWPIIRQVLEAPAKPMNEEKPRADAQFALPPRSNPDSKARRMARYEEIRSLLEQGLAVREVSRRLGVHRRDVRAAGRAETFPELAPRVPRPGKLSPYEPYLRERWTAGCRNGMQLYRELVARGYSGSRSYVSLWAASARRVSPTLSTPLPKARRVSTPREIVWRLIRCPTELAPWEQESVARLRDACPQLAAAHELAQEFARMVRERDPAALEPWLAAASEHAVPEFRGFATGIRRDLDAVAASLELEWSTGQVEGQNHRLKMVKRQMYGRAGFELLKRRILETA